VLRRLAASTLAALIAACTSAKEVRDLSGETAIVIECGPRIERCEARARELCSRGYDVLATGENRVLVTSGTLGEPRTMSGVDNVIKVKCR